MPVRSSLQTMSFLSQAEQKSIANAVIEEALEIAVMPEESWPLPEADNQSQSPEDGPPTKKKEKRSEEDVIASNPVSHFTASDTTQIKEDIDKEINIYLCLGVECSENPLKWWQNHQRHFPNLSHIAKKYLCIPATSVLSERAIGVAIKIHCQ